MDVWNALEHLTKIAAQPGGQDLNLAIPVYAPGSIGASPTVPVAAISAGIDWDHGRVFMHPEGQLSRLTPETQAALDRSMAKLRLEREHAALLAVLARVHDACADPSRPRQAVGEMLAAALRKFGEPADLDR
ncbi:hypothetical protein [Thiomonas sp.]